jgi:hypothetical protein
MEFAATGPDGKRVEFGRLLLKQDLRPRRMQGFHLHVNQPGDQRQPGLRRRGPPHPALV